MSSKKKHLRLHENQKIYWTSDRSPHPLGREAGGVQRTSAILSDASSTVQQTSSVLRGRNTTPGKSLLKTEHDHVMAARQMNFDKLSTEEQKKQTKWAQQHIELTGNCPGKAQWRRTKPKGGYICAGNVHWVTDALLAEGKGGMMISSRSDMFLTWEGPVYPKPYSRYIEAPKRWKQAAN
ncbi:hypothetical protein BDZ45DRAFT_736950 [Acephala macrosclerotiorum]|nr:hypothetical protein BDZ45DRAFT_736950 [Acephala macrosclerotiorum]